MKAELCEDWVEVYSIMSQKYFLYKRDGNRLFQHYYSDYEHCKKEYLPKPIEEIESKYIRIPTRDEVINEVVNKFGWVKDDYTGYKEEEIK